MSFHGTAVPVVRLSTVLGFERTAELGTSRVIVFGEDPPVGLLVDAVLNLDLAARGKRAAKRLDVAELLAGSFIAQPATKRIVARVEERADRGAAAEERVAILSFEVAGQRSRTAAGGSDGSAGDAGRARGLAAGGRNRSRHRSIGAERALPVVWLAALLGLKQSTGRKSILVTRLGEALVGLACGPIEGVRRVPVSAIEAVPPILQRGAGDAEIDAIARVEGTASLISILSPKKLFANRDIGRAIERTDTGALDMQTVELAGSSLPLVVFTLGAEVFGLPLDAVEEIVQLPEMLTRVPKAPKFVAGMMNLRGRPLPVIDLRLRFQSAAAQGRGRARVVVVSTEQLQAGFVGGRSVRNPARRGKRHLAVAEHAGRGRARVRSGGARRGVAR